MGSPKSVIIANMVMEDVERRALSSYDSEPQFWKQYVDDVCTVTKPEECDRFLNHLNSIEPSIQFTMENKSDKGILPFLDTRIAHLNSQ